METPGMILKREREARGISLKEISRVTRIPVNALSAMECDRFEDFSAEVFVRGFLRNYAKEVQVSSQEIIQAYDAWKNRASQSFAEPVEQTAVRRDELPRISRVLPALVPENNDFKAREKESSHNFRYAYVLAILIAVISITVSVISTGTGEAEEGDVYIPEQGSDVSASPFLISTKAAEE